MKIGLYTIDDNWTLVEFYEHIYYSHKYIDHMNLTCKPSIYISHINHDIQFSLGIDIFKSTYARMYGKYIFSSVDDAKAQVDEFFIKFSKLKVFL
jgi:hypothetical protein